MYKPFFSWGLQNIVQAKEKIKWKITSGYHKH